MIMYQKYTNVVKDGLHIKKLLLVAFEKIERKGKEWNQLKNNLPLN